MTKQTIVFINFVPTNLEENITIGDTVLDKNFKEFIALLNSNKVKHLVVGGYALAFHGHPRYTKDIDIRVCSWLTKGRQLAILII